MNEARTAVDNERRESLRSLVRFDRPLQQVLDALGRFEWDQSEPLLVFAPSDVGRILTRYIEGELSAADVEEWANAVEGRDDLEPASEYRDFVAGLLFELANPVLQGELSPERARSWMQKISKVGT